MSGGDAGSGSKLQMFESFSKIKQELLQNKQVSVGKVCEILKIPKPEADRVIQAYFKKYEQKCLGVYVITSIQTGRISTKLEASTSLISDAGRTVLSSYLVGLLSLDHQNEKLQYSDFAYSNNTDLIVALPTSEQAEIHQRNLLKTSLEENQQGLKRTTGPGDFSEEDILKKQTTKLKPEGDHYAANGENKPVDRTASGQQKKPSLLNFFQKK